MQKYGSETQNTALDYVRAMDAIREAVEGQSKDYKASLKVDVEERAVTKELSQGGNVNTIETEDLEK